MKKPWRFTKKQVRNDQPGYNNGWLKLYHFFERCDWKKVKQRDKSELRKQLNNSIDEAVYREKVLNKTNWNFW